MGVLGEVRAIVNINVICFLFFFVLWLSENFRWFERFVLVVRVGFL